MFGVPISAIGSLMFPLLRKQNETAVQGLGRPEVVRKQLGKRGYLINGCAHRILEHYPRDDLGAGRGCQGARVTEYRR